MGADIVNLANVLSTQTAAIAPDAQAKQVLKEAVDAVVNSFAKHTQGYGRGKCAIHFYCYSQPLPPACHTFHSYISSMVFLFACIFSHLHLRFFSSFTLLASVSHWRRI